MKFILLIVITSIFMRTSMGNRNYSTSDYCNISQETECAGRFAFACSSLHCSTDESACRALSNVSFKLRSFRMNSVLIRIHFQKILENIRDCPKRLKKLKKYHQ